MHDHAHVGRQRIDFADSLIDPSGPPQRIVSGENIRVAQLLAETNTDPYEDWSKLRRVGHHILAKAGLLKPKTAQPVERPWLSDAQANRTEYIKSMLDTSREEIRAGTVFGVDDFEVDTYLGLRGAHDHSMLPPLFRRLHGEIEESLGHKVSFLEWMADHATDDQLLNVWQWHDSYLEKLDNEPGFKEKVARVKKDYLRGSNLAVKARTLHSSASVTKDVLEAIQIVHASPLTAYTATMRARADKKSHNSISVGRNVDDEDLFHEITHINHHGLVATLDEGATEIITAEIYNRAHPRKDKYDLGSSVYAQQIDLHSILERLTGGELSTYELSRIYAGGDRMVNTAHVVSQVDKHLGLPIFSGALRAASDTLAAITSRFAETDGTQVVSLMLLNWMSVFKDIYLDEHGRMRRHDAQQLLRRMVSKEMLQKYDQDTIGAVATITVEAIRDSEEIPRS